MANEDKKDFNAMLHDSKDMPKMKSLQIPKAFGKITEAVVCICTAYRL